MIHIHLTKFRGYDRHEHWVVPFHITHLVFSVDCLGLWIPTWLDVVLSVQNHTVVFKQR